ncbi:DNA glycosylase [Rhodotorula sp. JG-1b]|nr:DNA glycosylase [Rhodotorula sp. JG-1b]
MPPKNKPVQGVARPPLPQPSQTHPCASLLPSALAPSTFTDRPHPPAYHCFVTSPYYPSTSRTTDEPPKKRSKASASAPKLPAALDTAIDAVVLQQKLLTWFDTVKEKRGMPWRKDIDPKTLSRKEKNRRGYEVWVSEIMLQQTTVAAVIPYWTKWMAEFPTVEALASEDLEAVNRLWKGLGYYSRAKRLLDGAKTVMEKHGGNMPRTAEGLLDIDGIGPYSAGSISSIAFAARSALVDGNVTRVLSRLVALHAPAAAKATTSLVWALADVLVPPQATEDEASPLSAVGGLNKPGAWNQALMELGATVCTPKNPKCEECPLSEECLAYAEARYVAHRPRSTDARAASDSEPDMEDLCNLCSPLPYATPAEARNHSVEVYPMAKEKTKKREEDTAVCVLEWVPKGAADATDEERQVLLVKRPEKGLLAGLFEFPAIDLAPEDSPLKASARSLRLDKLVRSLIDTSNCLLRSPEDANDGALVSRTSLPTVTQVYSHITRTYLAERVVLSSPSLPPLRPAAKRAPADSAAVVQSRAGAAKWVPTSQVASANIGGAVGKIWDERNSVVRGGGGGGGCGGKKVGTSGKKAGNKGKNGSIAAGPEKGQASLAGFFVKKGSSDPRPPPPPSSSAKQELAAPSAVTAEDDDIVIVETTAATGRVAESEMRTVLKSSPVKVYKKRRIASDSEDE